MFWLMEWGLAEEHHNIKCAGGTYFLHFATRGGLLSNTILNFLRKASSQMCSPFVLFPTNASGHNSAKWRELGALGPNSRKNVVTFS